MVDSMENIVNLCKSRGYIYPGSDIYGGLANTWDYGPLGVELKNNIKIYYSTNEKVTNDFTNSGNNWVEESKVTNWTDIKSYYIDLGEFVMSKGDEITFKYDISIPEGISYEKVAYSAHAVYFNLDTPDGKLADYTEPNKLGFRITRKYNMNHIWN